MKVCEALKLAKAELTDNEQYAEFILLEFLGKDRAWLFLNSEFELDEKPYFRLVRRFASGEPFEYIFNKASFYGLDFAVKPNLSAKKGVLIPRFDSEILLELCRAELSKGGYKGVLEIGFGSGALSIVLARLTGRKITACDTNKTALKVAQQNAKAYGVGHLVNFLHCDFRKIQGNFDFIFSNPPYIARNYPLDKWVFKEPKMALFGGEKGHEMLEKIIIYAKEKRVKALACEFGYNQRKILHKILRKNGFEPEFFKDTGGFDRAFLARNLRI